MPSAPHWPMLAFLTAATVGLLRRRAAGDRSADGTGVVTRPRIEEVLSAMPTEASVYSYAVVGCSDREIADRFGWTEADVRSTFAAVLTVSRAIRAFNLRRAQTDAATGKGNASLLMWLGRNELGQVLVPAHRGLSEPEVVD